MMLRNLVFLCCGLIAACSSGREGIEKSVELERLPTAQEVTAHVTKRWVDDYGKRFARLLSRPTDAAEFVSIRNVECGYYIATIDCSFDARASFPDGEIKNLSMSDDFRWTDAGQLESIIVLYHHR